MANVKKSRVLIAIITYNNEHEIGIILNSLLSMEVNDVKLCVSIVDNNSNDATVAVINQFMKKYESKKVKFIASPINSGWSKGNNRAMRNCDWEPEYVLLLNPDARIKRDDLKAMVVFLEDHKDVSAISPFLVNENGKVRPGIFPIYTLADALFGVIGLRRIKFWLLKAIYGRKEKPFVVKDCYPSGAAVLIRWSTLQRIGFLDERYFLYHDDADLGRKLQSMHETLVCMPSAIVNHKGGASTKTLAEEATGIEVQKMLIALQSEFAYHKKWYGPAISQFIGRYKLMIDLPLRAFFRKIIEGKDQSILIQARRLMKERVDDG